jgi:hypothetical protein
VIRTLLVAMAAMLSLVACGYHTGGAADMVPKGIQTIAIPAFSSPTTRYKLVDTLPEQIGREFQARTRFRIVNDPSQADAILNGRINLVQISPAVSDPTSGKATSINISANIAVQLIERATGRVIYNRPSFGFRQSYQVALDPHQVFDESGPALDRMSRDIAHDVVSAIVENF